MQRKALKQVFSGEKTQLSSDFTEFERDIDVRRLGVERLHATSLPFFHQITKVKPSGDPYPPSGSGKEKILHTEALGLVMIDYGGDVGGSYGDGLTKYGRARCKLAIAQEEFGNRLSENYISGMELSMGTVNDYKTFRKKLDSRRLTLDAAITRANGSKKDGRMLEFEVDTARARFEEIEEETQSRMYALEQLEEQQFVDLGDLLEAEYDYFVKCKEIMEELRESFPTTNDASGGRPRAKSNASSRSIIRTATTRSYRTSANADSEDESVAANRSRSHSNASSSSKVKEKRSIIPSFGAFGKKSGLSNVGSLRKGPAKEKYGTFNGDEHRALQSDEDDEDHFDGFPDSPAASPSSSFAANGRARSQSTLSASRLTLASDASKVPPMRRTITSPPNVGTRMVKALYDFPGTAADELPLRAGQIVEVKKEVSDDWWLGECDGHSGLFPKTYTEEYTAAASKALPTRQRSIPPAPVRAPTRRTMAPSAVPAVAPSSRPVPAQDETTSDSDLESQGFDDGDLYATASLASAPAPAPTARTRMPAKKSAPPPPPAKRSQSSSNISSSVSTSFLSPPTALGRARSSTLTQRFDLAGSSPEGSPFAGSDDEEADMIHEVPSPTVPATQPPPLSRNLSHGLGSSLVSNGGASGMRSEAGQCGQCGCGDFTQNVFKAKGLCSTCYHQH